MWPNPLSGVGWKVRTAPPIDHGPA
jgi:hypothetical protein